MKGCSVMNNVLETIKKICNDELYINIQDIVNLEVPLVKIGIDSIALMTLIVYLEEHYSTEIDMDAILLKNYNEVCLSDLIETVQIYDK